MRFVKRITLLNKPMFYEQGADSVRVGEYVQRWRRWISNGVPREKVSDEQNMYQPGIN